MHLVVIGWIYVVLMMAITEETVVAGVMTFVFYGLLPVGIIVYLGGSRQRRLRRQMEEETRRTMQASREEASVPAQASGRNDPPPV